MDEPPPPLSVAESQADAQAMIASAAKVDASVPLESNAADLALANQQSRQSAEPILYKGNDRQINLPVVNEPVRFVGDDVTAKVVCLFFSHWRRTLRKATWQTTLAVTSSPGM